MGRSSPFFEPQREGMARAVASIDSNIDWKERKIDHDLSWKSVLSAK